MAPVGTEENILVTMPRLKNAESVVGNQSHGAIWTWKELCRKVNICLRAISETTWCGLMVKVTKENKLCKYGKLNNSIHFTLSKGWSSLVHIQWYKENKWVKIKQFWNTHAYW